MTVAVCESRVRGFLLANTEIIHESLQALEARRMAEEQGEAAQMIASNADALLRNPDSPVSGNLAGDVTMVEFFDYNCTYCRSVAQSLDRVMEFDGSIRMVFKEFPIIGSISIFAAKAVLASKAKGGYGEDRKRGG